MNGYRINLYSSSSFTIIIIIPYGTNSLYMSVYFLSIFFCLFVSFELKPLIDEIDDHWLTSYVFCDSLTILKCRGYNEYKKRRMSVCMIKKEVIDIPADTPQQIFDL
jgi:hypothetical protein